MEFPGWHPFPHWSPSLHLVLLLPAPGELACSPLLRPQGNKAILEKDYYPEIPIVLQPPVEGSIISLVHGTLLMDYTFTSKGHVLMLLMIPTWIIFSEMLFSRFPLWTSVQKEWITTKGAVCTRGLFLGNTPIWVCAQQAFVDMRSGSQMVLGTESPDVWNKPRHSRNPQPANGRKASECWWIHRGETLQGPNGLAKSALFT